MAKFNIKDKIKSNADTYIAYFTDQTIRLEKNKIGTILKYNEEIALNDLEILKNNFAKKIKIDGFTDKQILLKFKGISFFSTEQVNNTDCKILINSFKYIDYESLQSYKPTDISKQIIVIDYLTREMVYMAKALKVKAIFTNSIDVTTYNNIKNIDLPIQIFTGFGKIPFESSVKQLIVDHSKFMILDFNYSRMILSKHNIDNTINFEVDF